MATELDIALIEIQQAKKILQNELHANERIMRAITESERLIKLKDSQIAEMRKFLQLFVDACNGEVVFIPNEKFEEIKQLLK
ncbi:MAG TPA: hypothetical protein PKI86_08480 [Chitinophagales bacterium]|jgi:hypothetical protein|nr:hypothetical protein [Chitinophagales bacterium]